MPAEVALKADEISRVLEEQLKGYERQLDIYESGTVLFVGDGVARIHGLRDVRATELVEFEDGTRGMALNLQHDDVGCVLFGDSRNIAEGQVVRRTNNIIEVPVGEELLGRVVDPLGELLGLNFTMAEDGFTRGVLEVDEKLFNPHHVVHGGVLYTMADTGMGGAVYSCLEEDELCATVEIKIVYLAPVTSGLLTCDTKVVHRGKRIVIVESEVTNDGRPVAKSTGTYSIFKASED